MAAGVALGAFGAHGLSNVSGITPADLDTWDTAVLYQLIQSLAVLMLGLFSAQVSSPLNQLMLRAAGWATGLFIAGVFFFSGSLYGLVLDAPTWLGPITPLGGTCLICGWLVLAFSALKDRSNKLGKSIDAR